MNQLTSLKNKRKEIIHKKNNNELSLLEMHLKSYIEEDYHCTPTFYETEASQLYDITYFSIDKQWFTYFSTDIADTSIRQRINFDLNHPREK